MIDLGAVIVAAGNGTRMGTAEKKQFLMVNGKPILAWTVDVFQAMPEVKQMVIVTAEADRDRCESLGLISGWNKVRAIVNGGLDRQTSVLAGVRALNNEWILVHDGVRPLVSEDAVRRCLQAAEKHGAAVLAVPVKDTIKKVDEQGFVIDTPDRSSLWAMHTPQVFRRDVLIAAIERAIAKGEVATDDAAAVERLGHRIYLVKDEETNLKITTPSDLDMAAFWLRKREEDKQ